MFYLQISGKENLYMSKIVRYAPSPTSLSLTHRKCPEQPCLQLSICSPQWWRIHHSYRGHWFKTKHRRWRKPARELAWLGIDWDESPENPGKYGPYRQSRDEIYQPLIDQLLMSNLEAYKCYCTSEEPEAEREAQRTWWNCIIQANVPIPPEEQAEKEAQGLEPVIRFRVPRNTSFTFDDMVKGEISFESDNVGGDFIIQKRDGMPTYNFCSCSRWSSNEDYACITRWRSYNTPKQLMIYDAFVGRVQHLVIWPWLSTVKQVKTK